VPLLLCFPSWEHVAIIGIGLIRFYGSPYIIVLLGKRHFLFSLGFEPKPFFMTV
jgi:hypothetical protein